MSVRGASVSLSIRGHHSITGEHVNRTTASFAALLATFILTAPLAAQAQMRRSAPDGAAPPPGPTLPRIPRSESHPFAGVWDGAFTLRADRSISVMMVFQLADSTKSGYAGATILPNGARAPHLETAVAEGEMNEMKWKQQNSGGGYWVYTGRLVTRDSIAGTVVLTDWPQLLAGETPPSGTFSLARRAPGA
jgi:hypothetical protein